jgi:hypothetical protein
VQSSTRKLIEEAGYRSDLRYLEGKPLPSRRPKYKVQKPPEGLSSWNILKNHKRPIKVLNIDYPLQEFHTKILEVKTYVEILKSRFHFDWVIYALVESDTGNVRYVGKTCYLDRRIYDHWRLRFVDSSHRSLWLRTVPVFPFVRVLSIGCGEWDESEKYWIYVFKTLGENLTNLTEGGGRQTSYKAKQWHLRQILF